MKRTDAFIVTLDHNKLSHAEIYNELRLIVALFNRVENTNFRLMRQGRLGKNNPKAFLYNQMIDRRLYRRVRIAEANHSDLYLYNRDRRNNEMNIKLNAVLKKWANMALASI